MGEGLRGEGASLVHNILGIPSSQFDMNGEKTDNACSGRRATPNACGTSVPPFSTFIMDWCLALLVMMLDVATRKLTSSKSRPAPAYAATATSLHGNQHPGSLEKSDNYLLQRLLRLASHSSHPSELDQT